MNPAHFPTPRTSASSAVSYPKRLIEVDLPIARISAHARKDQNIRKGHLHSMHVWWATRPLASCRAVLMATLLPDPADPHCPPAFADEARRLMRDWAERRSAKSSADSFSRLVEVQHDPRLLDDPERLRRVLLDFIADFAAWEAGVDEAYLKTARALVAAAHPDGPPLVLDPFAGAGSIPFEALRVRAQAFASDLNPVAVLLNKVALEYLPKYGQRLAEAVEYWGRWMLDQARQRLGRYYPPDEHGHTPLAYIWARTITCEGPGCGAEVPMLGMLWLSRKPKNRVALRYRGVRTAETAEEHREKKSTAEAGRASSGEGRADQNSPRPSASSAVKYPRVEVEIFSPQSESEVQPPLVNRFSVTCPCCGYTTPYKNVREQLRARRGGTRDARMVAVITLDPKERAEEDSDTGLSVVRRPRFFRLPTAADLKAAREAEKALERLQRTAQDAEGRRENTRSKDPLRTSASAAVNPHLPPVPDEPTPWQRAWPSR